MKVAFATLGCKVNQFDTQAMRELFIDAGHEIVPFESRADAYIINTCTVTAVSDKKSRALIARAHAKNPEAVIAATGCYAQRAAQALLRLPGVSLTLGTKDRARIVELVTEAGAEKRDVTSALLPDEAFEPLRARAGERVRATLKIQEGCNRFCSYCIIPYVRGRARSLPPEAVYEQAARLADGGFREIVLVGISLASYAPSLLDAVQAACAAGVQRVRLGSLDPELLTETFIRGAAAEQKLCRQYHIALQSGSAGVLSRMNRAYSPEDYRRAVEALREAIPGAAVTTDVIAGFPGETEREFEETCAFMREMAFARVHIFPYSRREGTAAAAMPGQLSANCKQARAARLTALGSEMERAYWTSCLGKDASVLFETCRGGRLHGYTDTYIPVTVPGKPEETGRMERIRLDALMPEGVSGKRTEVSPEGTA